MIPDRIAYALSFNATTYFTYREFVRSEKATELGIDNIPEDGDWDRIQKNITNTCKLLEQVREVCGGHPIDITSGYRRPELNAAIPGSSDTSQHLDGLACDFTVRSLGVEEAFVIIRDSGIKYDQLIAEHGAWIHISYPRTVFRKQAFRQP